MTRRWIVLPVVGFGLVAGSVGSYAAWSNRAFGTEEGAGDGLMAEDARQMTQAYLRACVRGREAASQCFKSEVADATRSNDLPRLLAICGNDDTPFRDSEDAALLVSRGLLMEERATELERLREFWRGREKNAAAWLALDADVLLRGGRADEARSLLSRTSFPGAEDAGRLARLALAADDPSSALELLNRATALAPNEADVRACRGRYFEDLGRPAEAAAEFAAALAMRDNDWVLRDELAECYRREGDLGAATATWLHAGRDAVADFAWVKAWFWNRVARPVSCDWEATAPDVGRLQWLAAYLVALPPGQFWIRDAERTRGPREPLVHRQETYWLHLLALFQEGQEDVAGCVLRATPPRYVTWQPDLADGLDRVVRQAAATGRGQPSGATTPVLGTIGVAGG
jgi:tetratricopeptide (TPR) repeat protein